MFEASRNINLLDPLFRPRVVRFLQRCKEEKFDVCVIEARRSLARQCWLYAKGRVLPKDWEKKYLGYDDPNISSEPKAAKVTWTLSSRHLGGMAIDCIPLKDGKAWWNAPASVWSKMYDLAENCNIKPMFRKHGFDRPHLSIDGN